MLLALALAACSPDPTDTGTSSDDSSGGDPEPEEDTAAEALAADDARVRALTGLPEGDAPCAAPQLVRVLEAVGIGGARG